MKPKSTLRGLFRLVLVCAIACGAFLSFRQFTANRLTVVNRSGQAIKRLSIAIGGGAAEFRDVSNGETVGAPFSIEGDDSFHVSGELDNGTKLDQDLGYVTNGYFRGRATFTVEPDSQITLVDSYYP